MSKIDLNSELLQLDRKHKAKKQAPGPEKAYPTKQTAKQPVKQPVREEESPRKDLLDELANAATQAQNKSRERKREAKEEKAKAQKVRDTSRLTAICAAVILVVAILFFFVFHGGSKKRNTSAKALRGPAAELGAANEWQHQTGSGNRTGGYMPPPQPPQQQNGFQSNPM